MKIFVLIFLVLMVSCEEYSKVLIEKNGATISPVGGKIDSVEILKWKVGTLFKYTVSKGIMVKVYLPTLRSEDAAQLTKQLGVDSWILRVSRDYSGKTRVLGEIFFPLEISSLQGFSSRTGVNFSIVYTAATSLTRFGNFQCPPYDHKKLITGASITRKDVPLQDLVIGIIDQKDPEDEKPQRLFLNPVMLDGEMSLLGTYIVELSLYSAKQSSRKAEYVEFTDTVIVSEEEDATVGGCEGYQQKINDSDTFKFKFGK